jgi:hypothetical protein
MPGASLSALREWPTLDGANLEYASHEYANHEYANQALRREQPSTATLLD